MLAVSNLEVVYNDVILVLRGISLEVPDGQIVALLGANGAGKTTVLRAISGLLDVHAGDVTKGEITLDGTQVHKHPASKVVESGITQVMEGRRIFAEFTVDENLRVGAHTNRAGMSENLERVYTLFPVLADRRKAVAGYLSGGEQQMLAMGRALMSGPRYLLLDEPSLGLDVLARRRMLAFLQRQNAELGTTVIVTSHDMAELEQLAGRIVMLHRGEIAFDGDFAFVRAQASDAFLPSFFPSFFPRSLIVVV